MGHLPTGFKIVLLLIVATASGCGYEKHYDVSGMPPFSLYAGKDVKLARDAWLLEEGSGNPEVSNYVICYPDDWDAQLYHESKGLFPERRLLLHAGTKIQVMHTDLWYGRQSIFQGFFSTADLYSSVKIKLNLPDWPSEVTAGCNGWSTEFIDNIDTARFKGMIRPAPWEPADTPPERRISWPDDKYLIRGSGQANTFRPT